MVIETEIIYLVVYNIIMQKSTITTFIGLFGGSWITGYLLANNIISDSLLVMIPVWVISIVIVGTIAVMIIGDESNE